MAHKRVRFEAEVRTIPCVRESRDKRQWMSKTQLLRISKQLHADAKDYRNKESTTKLSEIFDLGVRERIEYLVELNQKNDSLRGIERHVNRSHRQNIILFRIGNTEAVLEAQRIAREGGMANTDDMRDMIATASTETSHNAKVYARLLALADRRVVNKFSQEDDEPEPRRSSASIAQSRPSITQLMKWSSGSVSLPRMSWTSSKHQHFSNSKVAAALLKSNAPATANPAA